MLQKFLPIRRTCVTHVSPTPAVGGLEALRAWLRAELFLTNFRPVPLTEHAVFRGRVYEKIGPQACPLLGSWIDASDCKLVAKFVLRV